MAERDRCYGLQDRARPAPLLDLLLERLDPLSITSRGPRLRAVIDVGLANPGPHRLQPVPKLLRDPLHRPVLRAQLGTKLAHQPHRPRLLLSAVPTRRRLPR